jgi:hypothetical protein
VTRNLVAAKQNPGVPRTPKKRRASADEEAKAALIQTSETAGAMAARAAARRGGETVTGPPTQRPSRHSDSRAEEARLHWPKVELGAVAASSPSRRPPTRPRPKLFTPF